MCDIKNMIFNTNGIISIDDFKNNGITKYEIQKLINEGKISRLYRGIYLINGYFPDEFYLFQKRFKNTVFSYNTACYLLGYSERTPYSFDITTYSGDGTRNFDTNVKIHYIKRENLDLGKIKVNTPMGNEVFCYDRERILCDLIGGNNTNIDKEENNEIVRKMFDERKIDTVKLINYAKKLGYEKKVRTVMEVLI